jgi:hypothetical protein
VGLQIDYLDQHIDAIPMLASWHHAEWSAVTPHLSVADRVTGFQARAQRGTIPTYRRLGWSELEEAEYAGRPGTIMLRRLLP